MTETKRTGAKVPVAREINRWVAQEVDGDTLLVRDWVTGEEVLLSWDDEAPGWTCSTCGLFNVDGRATQPVVTCVHVMGGLRGLPVDEACQIGGRLLKHRKGKTAQDKAVEPDSKAIEAARAAIARAEARASVGKHDDRDAAHQQVTSVVTTRVMTDEDRARIAERRAKKKRTFAYD
jgi:hypothetical protein